MSVTTTKPPVPAPASNVVPFAMPPGMPAGMWSGGGFPAGCCPPGGLDNLMQCWCDVQAAQSFICAMMIQCIQQNPAVTAAIIAAIEASGSSLPLIGVTNGTDAQPGQVGEWVRLTNSFTVPGGNNTTVINMGVLQPGDWDCWAWLGMQMVLNDASFALNPVPAGFSDTLTQSLAVTNTSSVTWLLAFPVRALISVPSLLAFNVTTGNPGAAGTCELEFAARRRR